MTLTSTWMEDQQEHLRLLLDSLTVLREQLVALLDRFLLFLQEKGERGGVLLRDVSALLQRGWEELLIRAQIIYNDASSRQAALYFGCGGLLTGALFGAVVGYGMGSLSTAAGGSLRSKEASPLMRAILATNTKRGVDGISLSVLPTPIIKNPTDVVIQVRSVGIDIIDTEVARGYKDVLRERLGLHRAPLTSSGLLLGRECSGTVVEVGSQVSTLEVSDRVWAVLPTWHESGVMAEYAVVPEQFVGLKPNNASWEGAATVPYAFVRFWEKCVAGRRMHPMEVKNKRVLIHLGPWSKNDGVGLLATQLLKSWGARVTVSTEEAPQVKVTEDESEMDASSSSEVAQMTFLHTLKTLGAESHLIIPTKDRQQLSNLTQRLFDIVINTDCSKMTPFLSNFCRQSEDQVIETFPVPELGTLSRNGTFLYRVFPFSLFGWVWSCVTRPLWFLLFGKGSFGEQWPALQVNEILNEARRLVESRYISPVVAKSFLPSQYDQAFRHVAKDNSGSAFSAHHAMVGKSVLVFNNNNVNKEFYY